MDLDSWLSALQQRHQSALTSSEFLKALRALSARYVERRSLLRSRSPLDSAGKRAAFAAFYAPLHFLTTREIVRAIGGGRLRAEGASAEAGAPLALIIDLGCGTGAASAAWALAHQVPPALLGIDAHPWALAEAKWNWTHLGLRGDLRRGELVLGAERVLARRSASLSGTGLIAGWIVNELDDAARRTLLATMIEAGKRGAAILVTEPIARSVVPWWDDWADAFVSVGGRGDEWKFDVPLPPPIAAVDEAAGFRRSGLSARSLWLAL